MAGRAALSYRAPEHGTSEVCVRHAMVDGEVRHGVLYWACLCRDGVFPVRHRDVVKIILFVIFRVPAE